MTLKTRRNRGELFVPTDRVAFDYTPVHQDPLPIPMLWLKLVATTVPGSMEPQSPREAPF